MREPLWLHTKRLLKDMIRGAVARAQKAGEIPAGTVGEIHLEVPQNREHGDLASNIALVSAGEFGLPPRQLAQAIVDRMAQTDLLARVEVAGPGFINFFLGSNWYAKCLEQIYGQGEEFPVLDWGSGRKIQVEYVSANPTGPILVVQARAGAVGDSLARILRRCGWDVQREFYVNDAGTQVEMLARSLEARYRQALGEEAELPPAGYPGDYLVRMGQQLAKEEGRRLLQMSPEERLGFFRQYAVERILNWQKSSLERYGVTFDEWFRESQLHQQGMIEKAAQMLEQAGYTYERAGALWFASTRLGDDKDRVLRRRDGRWTYLAADIAYHLHKFERGFERVIDIWGPDHHGHITRMKAAVQALGFSKDALEVLIVQLVRLVRGNQLVRMAKRKGEYVSIDELLDEVGSDAARFFFLMRTVDSHLDFDLDLARAQTSENPVYYVQYAHARVASLRREAAKAQVKLPSPEDVRGELLTDSSERALIKQLALFPEAILGAAEQREPHRIARYALEVATAFHAFYTRCRILGNDPQLTAARFALACCTGTVLRQALYLMGVSAPESM